MPATSSFNAQLRLTLYFCGLLFAIDVLNIVSGRSLLDYGLIPRDTDQLFGVLVAPFLHIHHQHFWSNIVALGPLLLLALMQYWQQRIGVILCWLIWAPGLLVWLLARDGVHVGSSGLVYGLFGFLIWAGLASRRVWRTLIAIALIALHVSLFWGLLPTQSMLSWEYHLAGFICGVIGAGWVNRRPSARPEPH